ncbi:YihY/virulence factor BrkB family protein [Rhodovarius crocodyli]|uniref:YihY/virulence factor BrkB family protein n=1 Tax=Rhodovarius crocodyli TaxID=1979269 RepID=A0A437MLT3_9PROT|nr:YihY/virulence factor BrkB family protein [Rhodovarius crocodyli]RVT98627.1 YihY/virulence factor BrkB family protein [Rhodovarius crocodyli]
MNRLWKLSRDTVEGFFADDCLTRAASIAYFTLFSMGPLLFIATGLAETIFGAEQVRQATLRQLTDLLGSAAARDVHEMAGRALGNTHGKFAVAVGLVTLMLTAAGAFGALQNALNAVWKTEVPEGETIMQTVTHFMRAKASAIGLVAATGFVLIASLAVNAGLAALGTWIEQSMPGGPVLASVMNTVVSVVILMLLFSAIYKVLPDRRLAWGDVFVGAAATAVLFTAGKYAIGLYLGGSRLAADFGAAGTMIIVLVWLYYSSVIFLMGAEFTRAWASRLGSRQLAPVPARPEDMPVPHRAGGVDGAVAVACIFALLPFAAGLSLGSKLTRAVGGRR